MDLLGIKEDGVKAKYNEITKHDITLNPDV